MNAVAESSVVYTPCPITLAGQRREVIHVGETVQQFLERVIEEADRERLEVRLNGSIVPAEFWPRVKPKGGQLLEVRGAVGKQALYIVAMIALTYFTFGAGGALAAGGGWAAGAGAYAGFVYAAAYIAGPAIGGKVVA